MLAAPSPFAGGSTPISGAGPFGGAGAGGAFGGGGAGTGNGVFGGGGFKSFGSSASNAQPGGEGGGAGPFASKSSGPLGGSNGGPGPFGGAGPTSGRSANPFGMTAQSLADEPSLGNSSTPRGRGKSWYGNDGPGDKTDPWQDGNDPWQSGASQSSAGRRGKESDGHWQKGGQGGSWSNSRDDDWSNSKKSGWDKNAEKDGWTRRNRSDHQSGDTDAGGSWGSSRGDESNGRDNWAASQADENDGSSRWGASRGKWERDDTAWEEGRSHGKAWEGNSESWQKKGSWGSSRRTGGEDSWGETGNWKVKSGRNAAENPDERDASGSKDDEAGKREKGKGGKKGKDSKSGKGGGKSCKKGKKGVTGRSDWNDGGDKKYDNDEPEPAPSKVVDLKPKRSDKAQRKELPTLDEMIQQDAPNKKQAKDKHEEGAEEDGEEESPEDDDVVEVPDEKEEEEAPASPCSATVRFNNDEEDEDPEEDGEEEDEQPDDEEEEDNVEEEVEPHVRKLIGFDGKPIPPGGLKASSTPEPLPPKAPLIGFDGKPIPLGGLKAPLTFETPPAKSSPIGFGLKPSLPSGPKASPTFEPPPAKALLGTPRAAFSEESKRNAALARQFLAQPDSTPLAEVGQMSALLGQGGESGMVGKLNVFCSEKEMKDRLESRQLDMFEMAKGCTIVKPEVNPALALKKYQRSSADKVYLADDIRSLEACARSLEFVMTSIINSDIAPDEKHCALVQGASFWQVYSFMRDRTRAVRVDLHVQQPWSTCTKVYILTHEICLRFEVLSMYLLTTTPELLAKYDEKMAHKACSQIMEPLLNAYVQARTRATAGEPAYLSPAEPAIRSYTILLLLVGGDINKVFNHLPTLPKALLRSPEIAWATKASTAFAIGDYSGFLRLWKQADFMSMTILTPLVNRVRVSLLWLMVNSSVPMRRDKLLLEDIRRSLAFTDMTTTEEFLTFHGLEVIELGTGQKLLQLPARQQGQSKWDVMHDETLQAAFNERLGLSRMPDKCSFPRRVEGLVQSKYESLPFERADVVFGAADGLQKDTIPAPVAPLTPATKSPVFSPAMPQKAAALTVLPGPAAPMPKTSPEAPASIVPAVASQIAVPAVASQIATPPPKRKRRSATSQAQDAEDDDEVLEVPPAPKASPPQVPSPKSPKLVSSEPLPWLPPPIFGAAAVPEKVKPFGDIFGLQSQQAVPKAAPSIGTLPPFPKASKPQKPAPAEAEVLEIKSSESEHGSPVAPLAQPPDIKPSPDLPETAKIQIPMSPVRTPQAPSAEAKSPAPATPADDPKELKRSPQKKKELQSVSKLRPAPSWRRTARPQPKKRSHDDTADAVVFTHTAKQAATELAASLFRSCRVFKAWKRYVQSRKSWAAWAQDGCRQHAASGVPCKEMRGLVARRSQQSVCFREAFHEAAVRAPSNCSLSAHRLALLLPDIHMEQDGHDQKSVLVHQLVESFSVPSSPAYLGNLPTRDSSGRHMSVRLLKKEAADGPPKLGISVIEIRPSSGITQEAKPAESVTLEACPTSGLLHILSQPLDLSMSDITWRSEAQRAKAALESLSFRLSGCDRGEPSRTDRPRALAVLFAVSLPDASSCDEARDFASQVAESLATRVCSEFQEALRIELGRDDIETQAFCVAVAWQREKFAGELLSGWTVLRGGLDRAAAWAVRKGSSPLVVPRAADLRLPERMLGHWAQQALQAGSNGITFPQSVQQLRESFEMSQDACAAELGRIIRELSPELPEWLPSSGNSPCQKVEAVLNRIWSLEPPLQEWQKCLSPVSFWASMRSYFQASLSGEELRAPRPPWWELTCPAFPEAALQAMVQTQPLVAPIRFALPEQTTFTDSNKSHPSAAASKLSKGVTTAETVEKAAPQAKRPRLDTNAGATQESEPPPPSKRRRSSILSDILRLDSAWSDNLLKSVALLAASVPTGS